MNENETDNDGREPCEADCGEPVDTETNFDKHDPRAPVYADDYVFHLGCEDELFEWSENTLD